MTHFFIDFDSTIISGEILDILADISLQNNPKKDSLCKEITTITQQGMLGQISFSESLAKRLPLLHAHQDHIQKCINHCQTLLTPSFQDFCARSRKQGNLITVVSGGFREIIEPIMIGIIDPKKIYANTFLYNDGGFIIGADSNNPLAHSQGKVTIIKQLQKSGARSVMIGDGFTDYETKLYGAVDEFRYYAEHVQRDSVMEKAQRVLGNFSGV